MWWLVTVRILPSLFRMIAATASAWITSSFWRRSVSSIADSAGLIGVPDRDQVRHGLLLSLLARLPWLDGSWLVTDGITSLG